MNIDITNFEGVIGGGRLPNERRRIQMTVPEDLVVSSPLDRKLARLLTLHPEVNVRFRNHDLASLDDSTKLALLEDINEVLGIQQLIND